MSPFKKIGPAMTDLQSDRLPDNELEEVQWPDEQHANPSQSDNTDLAKDTPRGTQDWNGPRRSARDRKPNLKYSKDFVSH